MTNIYVIAYSRFFIALVTYIPRVKIGCNVDIAMSLIDKPFPKDSLDVGEDSENTLLMNMSRLLHELETN